MRDLLTSLSTNLHILVVATLIVGMGLGMVSNAAPNANNGSQKRSIINLSTSPPQPSTPDVATDTTPSSKYSVDTPVTQPAEDSPANDTTDANRTPSTIQPALVAPRGPCADCEGCSGACMTEPDVPLPKPRPYMPACCGGMTTSLRLGTDRPMCPVDCAN